MRLLLEFDGYHEEQALIGRMLMAYAEFEFILASLIGQALGADDHTGARTLFRVRGEAARIDVADAILRPYFKKYRLDGSWGNAFGAVWYCKDIRNQYAHCHWLPDDAGLAFINMDKDTAPPEGPVMVLRYPVDLALLKSQHGYFEYANDWMWFFQTRCRRIRGELAPEIPAPKSIPQPPKSNLAKPPLGSQKPETTR